MDQAAKLKASAALLAARYANAGPLLLAGLSQHYASDMSGIASQWQRFGPHIGKIPGQIGRVAYGVWYNVQSAGSAMDHLCAVEISNPANLPSGLTALRIPAQRYAIFSHPGNVSTISRTVDAVFHSWLPASGHTHASGAESSDGETLAFFERYGENFDPGSGEGDIEIWVPIKE
ncbi:MAG TPA: GyrI-like domain-containing protein [Candidatus Acidoferrum sp.]|nr:GyrI-like domain-containing protein [Candidatus Acidoferrum sp.]